MSVNTIIIGGESIHWRELPHQEVGESYSEFTSKREWLFDGSLDKSKIQIAAQTITPAFDINGGITRFYESHSIKELGGGAWSVPVQYRSKPAHWEMSVRTSGGTAKMLQSYRTERGYDCTGVIIGEDPVDWRNGVIPDFKKAIGVHGDSVDGCDIVVPHFDFSINLRFELVTLSASYLMALYSLTGKANDRAFTLNWSILPMGNQQTLTFAAGDLRFMGANVKRTSKSEVDLTLDFSASKGLAGGTRTTASYIQVDATAAPPFNQVEVTVDSSVLFSVGQKIYIVGESDGERIDGGEYEVKAKAGDVLTLRNLGSSGSAEAPTVLPAGSLVSADTDRDPLVIGDSNPIRKAGWEYLWVRYEEATDSVTQSVIRKPIAAYVEQVVKYGDFTLIGLAQ